MMHFGRFTLLDGVAATAVSCIVGVVVYRYYTQQHFDLFGLLVMITAVAGYLAYRKRPGEKKDDSGSEHPR